MKGCLTAIAKLIGGYWYFENKTLYLFRHAAGPGARSDRRHAGALSARSRDHVDDRQVASADARLWEGREHADRGGDRRGRRSRPAWRKPRCSTPPAGRRSRRVVARWRGVAGADLYGRAARRRRRPRGAGRGAVGAAGAGAARRRAWTAGAHRYAVTFRDGGGRIAAESGRRRSRSGPWRRRPWRRRRARCDGGARSIRARISTR